MQLFLLHTVRRSPTHPLLLAAQGYGPARGSAQADPHPVTLIFGGAVPAKGTQRVASRPPEKAEPRANLWAARSSTVALSGPLASGGLAAQRRCLVEPRTD